MDTQQDALHAMEFRLEGEVQEYITMTFVVRELKSALGKKKIILELWDSRHVKKRRQQDCHRQWEYISSKDTLWLSWGKAIWITRHLSSLGKRRWGRNQFQDYLGWRTRVEGCDLESHQKEIERSDYQFETYQGCQAQWVGHATTWEANHNHRVMVYSKETEWKSIIYKIQEITRNQWARTSSQEVRKWTKSRSEETYPARRRK